jgi:hypothetical protein
MRRDCFNLVHSRDNQPARDNRPIAQPMSRFDQRTRRCLAITRQAVASYAAFTISVVPPRLIQKTKKPPKGGRFAWPGRPSLFDLAFLEHDMLPRHGVVFLEFELVRRFTRIFLLDVEISCIGGAYHFYQNGGRFRHDVAIL